MMASNLGERLVRRLVQFEFEEIDPLCRTDIGVNPPLVRPGLRVNGESQKQEGDEEDGLVVSFVAAAYVIRNGGEIRLIGTTSAFLSIHRIL